MELIGVKFRPNGLICLFGRSYCPSKLRKSVLKNGLCSRVPGILGQKFLRHHFSRVFLDKISVLLVRSETRDAVFSQN